MTLQLKCYRSVGPCSLETNLLRDGSPSEGAVKKSWSPRVPRSSRRGVCVVPDCLPRSLREGQHALRREKTSCDSQWTCCQLPRGTFSSAESRKFPHRSSRRKYVPLFIEILGRPPHGSADRTIQKVTETEVAPEVLRKIEGHVTRKCSHLVIAESDRRISMHTYMDGATRKQRIN